MEKNTGLNTVLHCLRKFFFIALAGSSLMLVHLPATHAQYALEDTVGLDKRVLTGTLSNGLTYYVQHNPKPEDKLELRLVVNAGSILETSKQLGLAHFVEHMAFNGSENFEKNELIRYLQSIGVSFGADLNAYTSFDETVYILPIPTDDEAKLQNGFLVLRDWAGGLSLQAEDIDAERNIIVEEWRTGQGVDQRLRDQYLPVLLQGSQYAKRLPIGSMDVIRNAPHEELRSFYRDWYRPDNMALVAVGDVDPASVVSLIEAYFGDLQNPSGAPERIAFTVPEHDETLISILTDEESPGIQVQLFYKHRPKPTVTVGDYKDRMIRLMIGGMLTQRLDEIRQKPDAPFVYAGARYGNFVRDLEFFTTSGAVTSGQTLRGARAFLEENERMLRFGFTESELARVKRSLRNSAERSFNEMDKAESRSIVGRYVSHFLNGTFAEGEDIRYELYGQLLEIITLQEVNQIASQLIGDKNRVLIITGPEQEAYQLPGKAELLALFDEVKDTELTPYEEDQVPEMLLSVKPNPGKVIHVDFDGQVDVTSVTLQNGVRVHFKPTEYKNDEILFTGSSEGGASLYPDEDHYTSSYASIMVNVMGIGDFSPTALRKVLAGKNVSVTPNISTYGESISGSTTPGDLEMALQLVYLYFTAPRLERELFDVYMANQRNQLETAQVNPDFQFNKRLNEIINQGNLRGMGIYDPEKLDLIDVDRGLEIYRQRFSNAADFQFLFTGNLNLEVVIPLVETYLGSLPSHKDDTEEYLDLGIRIPRGLVEKIQVGKDEKSQVILYFSGPTSYDLEKSQQLGFLGEILTNRLIETLREEIGGVYGVGARGALSRIPEESFSFSVSFPCSPDNVDMLTEAVWEEIGKIQRDGPLEEDMGKVREARRISLDENMKRNAFWHGQLNAAITAGMPLNTILGARDRVLGVSAEQVKAIAHDLLGKENLLHIIRLPLQTTGEAE